MVIERAALAFARGAFPVRPTASTAAAESMTTPLAAPLLGTCGTRGVCPVPGLSPLHLDWARDRLRIELQAIETLGHCSRRAAGIGNPALEWQRRPV